MSEKITVTRALAELGHLNDRIERAVKQGTYFVPAVGDKDTPHRSTLRTAIEAQHAIKSSFDSVEGLLLRKQTLATAIAVSNANTIVTVAGKVYTVAEAIAVKNTVATRRAFLDALKQQAVFANRQVEELNAQLEVKIQSSYEAVYGKSPDPSKIPANARDQIAEPLKKQFGARVLSYNDASVASIIGTREDELEQFVLDVDFALSEINARTEIEV